MSEISKFKYVLLFCTHLPLFIFHRDAKLQHSKAILEEKVSQVINLKHLVQDLEKSKLDLIHKENREKENITSQLKLDQQNMDAHYQKQILALESSLREKDYEISTLK